MPGIDRSGRARLWGNAARRECACGGGRHAATIGAAQATATGPRRRRRALVLSRHGYHRPRGPQLNRALATGATARAVAIGWRGESRPAAGQEGAFLAALSRDFPGRWRAALADTFARGRQRRGFWWRCATGGRDRRVPRHLATGRPLPGAGGSMAPALDPCPARSGRSASRRQRAARGSGWPRRWGGEPPARAGRRGLHDRLGWRGTALTSTRTSASAPCAPTQRCAQKALSA
jgi:hypothetical protein